MHSCARDEDYDTFDDMNVENQNFVDRPIIRQNSNQRRPGLDSQDQTSFSQTPHSPREIPNLGVN